MPNLDALEFCRLLRLVPGCERTTVVYAVRQDEFASRAKSLSAPSEDLISKPVMPMELAVKALTYSLDGGALKSEP
jgi:CheY-like chemotaxis protein